MAGLGRLATARICSRSADDSGPILHHHFTLLIAKILKPLHLNNVQGRFTASRDDAGVPHIVGDSLEDALFGLGYLHATDRGTQLLFARCVASGQAAELIANTDELLEMDRFFRRIGLYRDLVEETAMLATEIRQQMAAYSDGVNAGMAGLGRTLPMWATGFVPLPWMPESVMLIGKLLSFGGLAISQLQNERMLMELVHAGVSDEALRELFGPRLDEMDLDLLRQVKMANPLSDEALELLTDLPRLAGSNAWVVAPHRSATGAALLASDPHLEINRLPAIWYEAVLHWGDRYVMGATLPGCPLFAVARTERLSWGVTYMKGDTIDYFIEDCRRGGATGWQYRRGDSWHDFRIRVELIERKGEETDVLHVYENDQGILDADPIVLGEGLQLSVAWSGMYPGNGRAIGTWLEVLPCRVVEEAMAAVRECPQPTLAWVFADRDGHIGMQTCGRFPRRHGHYTGLTPIPAWDERNHWDGWQPLDILPAVFDPPEGFIATANEEQNPLGVPLLVTQPLSDFRRQRIVQRLEQLPAATLLDMQQLQYDVVSLHARRFLDVVLPHLPEGEIKQRLSAWDCSFDVDSHEASLCFALYRNVMHELLGHERSIGWRRLLYLCSRAGYSMMVLTAADRAIGKEKSRWFGGHDKREIIRRAAERAADEPDVPWSEINYFHFTDRFFGNHQVGRMLGYKSRRVPMPGCHATPFQGHVLQTATRELTFAPSYHFVTDMSTDEAWTNLPGGPSESRFSAYYKSDVPRWLKGEYKRLAKSEESGERRAGSSDQRSA